MKAERSGAFRKACDGCEMRSRRSFVLRVTGAVALLATADEWVARLGAEGVSDVAASQTDAETASYPVPAKDGVSIDKKEQVILVRYKSKVMAFPLSCPHENTALRWKDGDLRFQCPKHDSKYTPEGVFTSGRATRNMDRFALTRDGAKVVVHLNQWFQSDTQATEWAGAVLAV
jgi:Rieske Fe-S protein